MMEEDHEGEDDTYLPTHLWCINSPGKVAHLLSQYCQDWEQKDLELPGTADRERRLWVEAEKYLSWCSDCLERYNEAKTICLRLHPQHTETIRCREVNRLRSWIQVHLERRRESDESASQLQMYMENSQFTPDQVQQPVAEILQHPRLLFDQNLNADFVEFIEFEYSSGTLIGCSADVPTNQIPGILLLLVHPNKTVCQWASTMLHRTPPISRENYDDVQQIISWILSPVEWGFFDNMDIDSWDAFGDHVLPKELVCIQSPYAYWKGVVQVLKSLDKDAIKSRLLAPAPNGHLQIANAIANVITESKQTDITVDTWQTNVFWPALECLEVLLSKAGCSLWQQLKPDILKEITSHPAYDRAISGELPVNVGTRSPARTPSLTSTAGSVQPMVSPDEPFIWLRTFVNSFLDVGDVGYTHVSSVIMFLYYRAQCGMDPENAYFDNDGCTAVNALQRKTQAECVVEKVMITFLDIIERLLKLKLFDFLTGSAHCWPHTFVLYLGTSGRTASSIQQKTKLRCLKIAEDLLRRGLVLDKTNTDYSDLIQKLHAHLGRIGRSHGRERRPSGDEPLFDGADIDVFVRSINQIIDDLKEQEEEEEGWLTREQTTEPRSIQSIPNKASTSRADRPSISRTQNSIQSISNKASTSKADRPSISRTQNSIQSISKKTSTSRTENSMNAQSDKTSASRTGKYETSRPSSFISMKTKLKKKTTDGEWGVCDTEIQGGHHSGSSTKGSQRIGSQASTDRSNKLEMYSNKSSKVDGALPDIIQGTSIQRCEMVSESAKETDNHVGRSEQLSIDKVGTFDENQLKEAMEASIMDEIKLKKAREASKTDGNQSKKAVEMPACQIDDVIPHAEVVKSCQMNQVSVELGPSDVVKEMNEGGEGGDEEPMEIGSNDSSAEDEGMEENETKSGDVHEMEAGCKSGEDEYINVELDESGDGDKAVDFHNSGNNDTYERNVAEQDEDCIQEAGPGRNGVHQDRVDDTKDKYCFQGAGPGRYGVDQDHMDDTKDDSEDDDDAVILLSDVDEDISPRLSAVIKRELSCESTSAVIKHELPCENKIDEKPIVDVVILSSDENVDDVKTSDAVLGENHKERSHEIIVEKAEGGINQETAAENELQSIDSPIPFGNSPSTDSTSLDTDFQENNIESESGAINGESDTGEFADDEFPSTQPFECHADLDLDDSDDERDEGNDEEDDYGGDGNRVLPDDLIWVQPVDDELLYDMVSDPYSPKYQPDVTMHKMTFLEEAYAGDFIDLREWPNFNHFLDVEGSQADMVKDQQVQNDIFRDEQVQDDIFKDGQEDMDEDEFVQSQDDMDTDDENQDSDQELFQDNHGENEQFQNDHDKNEQFQNDDENEKFQNNDDENTQKLLQPEDLLPMVLQTKDNCTETSKDPPPVSRLSHEVLMTPPHSPELKPSTEDSPIPPIRSKHRRRLVDTDDTSSSDDDGDVQKKRLKRGKSLGRHRVKNSSFQNLAQNGTAKRKKFTKEEAINAIVVSSEDEAEALSSESDSDSILSPNLTQQLKSDQERRKPKEDAPSETTKATSKREGVFELSDSDSDSLLSPNLSQKLKSDQSRTRPEKGELEIRKASTGHEEGHDSSDSDSLLSPNPSQQLKSDQNQRKVDVEKRPENRKTSIEDEALDLIDVDDLSSPKQSSQSKSNVDHRGQEEKKSPQTGINSSDAKTSSEDDNNHSDSSGFLSPLPAIRPKAAPSPAIRRDFSYSITGRKQNKSKPILISSEDETSSSDSQGPLKIDKSKLAKLKLKLKTKSLSKKDSEEIVSTSDDNDERKTDSTSGSESERKHIKIDKEKLSKLKLTLKTKLKGTEVISKDNKEKHEIPKKQTEQVCEKAPAVSPSGDAQGASTSDKLSSSEDEGKRIKIDKGKLAKFKLKLQTSSLSKLKKSGAMDKDRQERIDERPNKQNDVSEMEVDVTSNTDRQEQIGERRKNLTDVSERAVDVVRNKDRQEQLDDTPRVETDISEMELDVTQDDDKEQIDERHEKQTNVSEMEVDVTQDDLDTTADSRMSVSDDLFDPFAETHEVFEGQSKDRGDSDYVPKSKTGIKSSSGLCETTADYVPKSKTGIQTSSGLCETTADYVPNSKTGIKSSSGLQKKTADYVPNSKTGIQTSSGLCKTSDVSKVPEVEEQNSSLPRSDNFNLDVTNDAKSSANVNQTEEQGRRSFQYDVIKQEPYRVFKPRMSYDHFDPFDSKAPHGEQAHSSTPPPIFIIDDDEDDEEFQSTFDLIDEDILSQLPPSEMIIISSDEDDDVEEVAYKLDFPEIKKEEEVEYRDINNMDDYDVIGVKKEEQIDATSEELVVKREEIAASRIKSENKENNIRPPLNRTLSAVSAVGTPSSLYSDISEGDIIFASPSKRSISSDRTADKESPHVGSQHSLYSDITSDDDFNLLDDEDDDGGVKSDKDGMRSGKIQADVSAVVVKTTGVDVASENTAVSSATSDVATSAEITMQARTDATMTTTVNVFMTTSAVMATTTSIDATSTASMAADANKRDDIEVNFDLLGHGEADDDNNVMEYEDNDMEKATELKEHEDIDDDLNMMGDADDDNAIIDDNTSRSPSSESRRPLSASSFYGGQKSETISTPERRAAEQYLEKTADKAGSSPSTLKGKSLWTPPSKAKKPGSTDQKSGNVTSGSSHQADRPRARALVKTSTISRGKALLMTMRATEGKKTATMEANVGTMGVEGVQPLSEIQMESAAGPSEGAGPSGFGTTISRGKENEMTSKNSAVVATTTSVDATGTASMAADANKRDDIEVNFDLLSHGEADDDNNVIEIFFKSLWTPQSKAKKLESSDQKSWNDTSGSSHQADRPRARALVKTSTISRGKALLMTMKATEVKKTEANVGTMGVEGVQPLIEIQMESAAGPSEGAGPSGFGTTISRGKENEMTTKNRLVPAVVVTAPVARPASFPAAKAEPTIKLTKMNFLQWVLAWECTWLTQGQDFSYVSGILNPLEIRFKKPKRVQIDFKEMDRYYEVFIPLLMIETWAKLRKDYNPQANPLLECVLISKKRETTVRCGYICNIQVPIPRDKESDPKFSLSEEDFVIVAPQPGANPLWINMFAVVLQVKTLDIPKTGQQEYMTSPGEMPPDNSPRKVMDVTLLMIVVDENFIGSEGMQFNLQVMGSLVTSIRQFEAIISLKKSILAKDILRFRRMDVFCCDNVPVPREGHESAIPSTKAEVTDAAVKAIKEPHTLPRIFLLQGPPGTGKTETIIGIIIRLLKEQNTAEVQSSVQPGCTQCHPKILLCAPSNNAVDVVTARLRQALKDLEIRDGYTRPGGKKNFHTAGHFSVIRLGIRDVHHRVKDLSLEHIVKEMKDRNRLDDKVNEEVNRTLRELDTKIGDVELKLNRMALSGTTDENKKAQLTSRKDELYNQRTQIKEKSNSHRNQPLRSNSSVNRMRQKVLTRADVICCTLSSAGNKMFQSHIYAQTGANQRREQVIRFSCVIVDEATQCTEPDVLIPLQYGASKLLLVGDPQQLPATVISQAASNLKYNQSLFERYYNYFKLNHEVIPHNPVRMLKTQYRMHDDICRFPSKQFYKGLVKSDPEISRQREGFFLRPYFIFDVCQGNEHCYAPGALVNMEEITLVKQIYRYIHSEVSRRGLTVTVGIITPYQMQKRRLEREFRDLRKPNVEVEISTVDGFQGRQKDVIILSCVRTNGRTQGIGFVADPKRMNVALTRARYALYIVGHVNSLYTNRLWRALIDDAIDRNVVDRAVPENYKTVVGKIKKRRDSNKSSTSRGTAGSSTTTENHQQRRAKEAGKMGTDDRKQPHDQAKTLLMQDNGFSMSNTTSRSHKETRHEQLDRRDREDRSKVTSSHRNRKTGLSGSEDRQERGNKENRTLSHSKERSYDSDRQKGSESHQKARHSSGGDKKSKEKAPGLGFYQPIENQQDGNADNHGREGHRNVRQSSGGTHSERSKQNDTATGLKGSENRPKVRQSSGGTHSEILKQNDTAIRSKERVSEKRSTEKAPREHDKQKGSENRPKVRHSSGSTHSDRWKQNDNATGSKERGVEKKSTEKASHEHDKPKGSENRPKVRHSSGGTHSKLSKQNDNVIGSKERDSEKRSTDKASHGHDRPIGLDGRQRIRHGSGGTHRSKNDQVNASKITSSSLHSEKSGYAKEQQRSSHVDKVSHDRPKGDDGRHRKRHSSGSVISEISKKTDISRGAPSESKSTSNESQAVLDNRTETSSRNTVEKPRPTTRTIDGNRIELRTSSIKSSIVSPDESSSNVQRTTTSGEDRTGMTSSLKPVLSSSYKIPRISTPLLQNYTNSKPDVEQTRSVDTVVENPDNRLGTSFLPGYGTNVGAMSKQAPLSPSRNRAKRGKSWRAGDGPGRQSYVQNSSVESGFSNQQRQYQIENNEPVLIPDDEDPPLSQNSHLNQVIERFRNKNRNQKGTKFAKAQPKISRRRGSAINQANLQETAGGPSNEIDADGNNDMEEVHDVNQSGEGANEEEDNGLEQPKKKRRKRTTKHNTSAPPGAPDALVLAPDAQIARHNFPIQSSRPKIDYNAKDNLMNSRNRRIAHKRKAGQSEDGEPLPKRTAQRVADQSGNMSVNQSGNLSVNQSGNSSNQPGYLPSSLSASHSSSHSAYHDNTTNRPAYQGPLQPGNSRTAPHSGQHSSPPQRAPTRLQPPSPSRQHASRTSQSRVSPHSSSPRPIPSAQAGRMSSAPRPGFDQPIRNRQESFDSRLQAPSGDRTYGRQISAPTVGQSRGQAPAPRSILRKPMQPARRVSVAFTADTKDNTEESRHQSVAYQRR